MNIDLVSHAFPPPPSSPSSCLGCCMHNGAPAGANGNAPSFQMPQTGGIGSTGDYSRTSSANSSPPHSSLFREMPPTSYGYGPAAASGGFGGNGSISGGAGGFCNAPPPFLPVRRAPRHKIKFNFCVFCKNNGEDETYYLSHTLKDDFGRVICPILSAYICPICGASGPVAHTIKYCPENKDDHYHQETAPITLLKQLRTSTGRPRALLGVSTQGIHPGTIGGTLPSLQYHQPMQQRGTVPSFYAGAPGSPFDTPPMTPNYGMVGSHPDDCDLDDMVAGLRARARGGYAGGRPGNGGGGGSREMEGPGTSSFSFFMSD